jgi:hypothetical protein
MKKRIRQIRVRKRAKYLTIWEKWRKLWRFIFGRGQWWFRDFILFECIVKRLGPSSSGKNAKYFSNIYPESSLNVCHNWLGHSTAISIGNTFHNHNNSHSNNWLRKREASETMVPQMRLVTNRVKEKKTQTMPWDRRASTMFACCPLLVSWLPWLSAPFAVNNVKKKKDGINLKTVNYHRRNFNQVLTKS